MDAGVWQRYVAVTCSQAWRLDAAATEELLQCIETLVAATPVAGLAAVNVFLGPCVGELTVDRSGQDVRIRIRSQQ